MTVIKHTLAPFLQAAVLLLVPAAAGAQQPPIPYVQIEHLERERSLGNGALAAFLNGRDPAVAIRAALAIGRTKRLQGIAPLLAHARDRSPAMRAMVVYALGLIAAPACAPAVLAGLEDPSLTVRVAADDAVTRLEFGRDLSRAQERGATNLLVAALLRLPLPLARARAATALEAFGGGPTAFTAERGLVAAFGRERDPFVRWHILWTIFRGYAVDVPRSLLDRALKDPDEVVRIEAVRALGRAGNPDAIAALETMTHDPSWRVQEQALESIKQVRGEPLTQHLTAIPAGVHVPPPQPDRFAALPALPRSPAAGKPAPPRARGALYEPTLNPATPALLTGPAAGAHPRVRMVTTQGNIYLVLYPEWAALTVENFLTLAARGYYDGNRWFRIVPDFVVQTGDPTNTGNGDAGYTIGAEENPIEQDSYVISMGLNYTDPPHAHAIRDSAGTQFYITLSPQLHLDRDFTVFGRVIGGFDVLGRLTESDTILRVERIPDGGP